MKEFRWIHILQFLARLRKSSFVRNILVVMTGSAVAQVISFALSPVVSRLFSPSDFGVFGSFGSLGGIIAAGVTLEYTQAIMLPKEKAAAVNLLVVSCLCTLAVSAFFLLVCFMFPAVIHNLTKTSGVWILVLLGLSTCTAGCNQACQAWCVRAKAFRQTSGSQVIRSVASSGAQIGFGTLHAGASGLIVSSVLADVIASVNLVRIVLLDLKDLRSSIHWRTMGRMAREYRDFPLYSASMNVMNAVSRGLPVILLAHFYSLPVAGAYAFAIRILQAPMGFVTQALRPVLFQKACETHNQRGRLLPLYVKTTAGLFALVALPSTVLLIWSPQIFTFVFGPQWLLAGEFARSLVLWLAVGFCNVPSLLFSRIIRVQGMFFGYELTLLAVRSLALIMGGIFLTPAKTVLLFSLTGAVMNIIFIMMAGFVLRSKEGEMSWNVPFSSTTR